MLTDPSPAEFMKVGSFVWKIGSKSSIKEKLIWSTNTEIRWSNPESKPKPSSKIEFDSILSVSSQEQAGSHFLKIECRQKSHKFQFKSSQTREKWHLGVQSLIKGAKSFNTLTPTLILGEKNTEKKQENPLIELINILKLHSNGQLEDLSINTLPTVLESFLKEFQSKFAETSQNPEENDPKRLSSKISMLRKRLKMMEIEKEASSQVENLTFLLDKERSQNIFLLSKIEEVSNERNQLFSQWGELKTELDKVQNTHLVSNTLDASKLPTGSVIQKVLQKGFVCYICTLASPEVIESLTLTPRRGYEEGVFKKRQVKLSSDLSSIIWKPVGLFSKRSFTLVVNDINNVLEGTEDSSRFEPYENCKYLTVICKNLTAIMCVENYYSLYLDALKDLFLNNFKLPAKEISPAQISKIASEQLQNQILTYSRMFKRYKTGLLDSIFSIHLKDELEEEFNCEVLTDLRNLNENLPLGIMAVDSENYLRNERKILMEKIQVIKDFKYRKLSKF